MAKICSMDSTGTWWIRLEVIDTFLVYRYNKENFKSGFWNDRTSREANHVAAIRRFYSLSTLPPNEKRSSCCWSCCERFRLRLSWYHLQSISLSYHSHSSAFYVGWVDNLTDDLHHHNVKQRNQSKWNMRPSIGDHVLFKSGDDVVSQCSSGRMKLSIPT